jgi:7-keto-8-aminopelargonate synthetase-like enzyme
MVSRHERLLRITERTIARGVKNRSGQLRTEDDRLEGAFLTLDGSKVLDFGSCSYLGLNRLPALKNAAIDAVERFGTGHSSSPMYTALGLYSQLEERLERLFGASVAVAPTTTLGHLAALPVLAGPDDLVLMDQHSHASLHLAADVLRGRGVTLELLPHNDVSALEARLADHADRYEKVWYVADGVYSMFGDLAPVELIHPLLDQYPNLHLYYDDAHGFGWQGLHGRGYVLSKVDWHERMVVAAGFAKSFGTTGGVLAFGNPAMARRVKYTGGPFTFSGPLQPATLGASIASADLHLSPAHTELKQQLLGRIELARTLLHEFGLLVAADETTPIWFIQIGRLDEVLRTTREVMNDGFYVNPAGYPAVPMGSAGIRFTQTLHQSEGDLRGLIESIARHMPDTEPDVTIDLRTHDREPSAVATN